MNPPAPTLAEVAIVSRLPRELGIFDYRIPETIADRLRPGDLVDVPFRRGQKTAVVLRFLERSQVPDHRLRSLTGFSSPRTRLTPEQLSLARLLAKRSYTSLATVIKPFVPPVRSGKAHRQPEPPDALASPGTQPTAPPSRAGRLVISDSLADLLERVRQAVETATTHRERILVLVPERTDVEAILDSLPEPTRNRTFGHSSALTDRSRRLAWDAVAGGRAAAVIGTSLSLFLPFPRLDAILLLHDEHRSHRQREQQPRFDGRWLARRLADLHGSRFTVLTVAPSLETWGEARREHWSIEVSTKRPIAVTTVDLREELRAGNFTPLPHSLAEAIRVSLADQKTVALLHPRTGFARSVACGDCGNALRCARCDAPLVGHGDESRPRLECHRCGERNELPPFCNHCHGTRFRFRGLGTERLERAVRSAFPAARVTRVEAGAAAPPPGTADILIGTTTLLPPAPWTDVTLAGVWIDPSLLLPDFRSEERTFQLLRATVARLPETARLFVMTSHPENRAVAAFTSGSLEQFYDRELAERSSLGFPPSRPIALLSYEAKDAAEAARAQASLEGKLRAELVGRSDVELFPYSVRSKRRGYTASALLVKLSANHPAPQFLQHIPSPWIVDEDPADLM